MRKRGPQRGLQFLDRFAPLMSTPVSQKVQRHRRAGWQEFLTERLRSMPHHFPQRLRKLRVEMGFLAVGPALHAKTDRQSRETPGHSTGLASFDFRRQRLI